MPQYVELKVGGIKVALFLRLEASFGSYGVVVEKIKFLDQPDCHMTV